jgi:hypothetical protein
MVIGQVADLPVCIVMLQGHLVGSIDLGQIQIRPISQTKVLAVEPKSSSQKKKKLKPIRPIFDTDSFRFRTN